VDNFDYELAAAGADELLLELFPSFEPELDELELDEESDPDELDAPDELDESDDDEPADSLLLADPLGELATVLLALSRLSLR
jgi:hypothetical protein